MNVVKNPVIESLLLEDSVSEKKLGGHRIGFCGIRRQKWVIFQLCARFCGKTKSPNKFEFLESNNRRKAKNSFRLKMLSLESIPG